MHFLALNATSFTHVQDCLTTQVQELFGCEGITYEGSMSSVGGNCRTMAMAHMDLEISKGDFDALIEDVVAGLTAAGVETADIQAAAPALLGMEDDIVEDESTDPSRGECTDPDAGVGDAG
jgi:hypothetical protein